MTSLWRLLRERPGFRWLWLGETVSLLGDWLSYVAVSLLALEAGEGATALALVFAAHVMPTALVAPVAGIVADRFDKRRLLVGTQVVMAGLMVAMVAAALAQSLMLVQAILFLRTTVAGFVYPAKQAALKALVADDELVDANAIDATTWSITFTLGTALGGVVAMAGPVVALVIDGVTFVVAAVLFARLPSLASAIAREERIQLRDMFTAIDVARTHPGLLEAVLSKAPLAVAGGGGWVLLNLTANRLGLWGSAALALGALQAIRGVGTGVGPALSKRLMARGYSAIKLLRLSVWVAFSAMAAFALAVGLELGWLALVPAVLVWGMGGGGSWVFSASQMQRMSPPSILGRLSSVDMLTFTLGQGAAALIAGLLVDSAGVPVVAGWAGIGLGLLAYLGLRYGLRAAPAVRIYAS